MAQWTSYFKIITPSSERVEVTDNQEMVDSGGAYSNYTWYQRLVQGSATRLTRYREYDLMDNDIEVSRALDTIAEEMTGNPAKNQDLFIIDVMAEKTDEKTYDNEILTVKTALRHWTKLHDWRNRLFKVARVLIKYGDAFFMRAERSEKWIYVNPKNIAAAVVDAEDVTDVIAWSVRKDLFQAQQGSHNTALNSALKSTQYETETIYADKIVWFSLNDDMAESAPFGESVLRPIYRSHKQKELLEDAIIIYRVQRAPERRVFYIDVGKMPPQRVKQYLETIKNEIKQKKVPNVHGGQMEVDSVYNPQSMSEDFFFAQRPDGRGSKVETLPGGQGLGELADLEYFQRKVWRGLKVPASYMIEQQEGGQLWNDGKTGIAYIQELRFALFVMRLQGYIERVIDKEFKRYLRKAGIHIDESLYSVRLPEPSNFGRYRQLELDSQLLGSFGSADGIQYMSKRFILEKYLQMTDEEIIRNERLKREELGLDPHGGKVDLPKIYGGDQAGMLGGGMGGGMGAPPPPLGGGFGGAELGMEAGGELGAGTEGGAVGAEGAAETPPAGGEQTPPPV